ncbi:hypothetical protein [Paraburkholderia humisilvae]|uniref:hypothetical protein n=1 Tax=Paraburkholderia humisilvae TaxID=627669 RepID=UPI0015824019|nr:hypothetical protein [Paraburkholderia humisilvae]
MKSSYRDTAFFRSTPIHLLCGVIVACRQCGPRKQMKMIFRYRAQHRMVQHERGAEVGIVARPVAQPCDI